MTRISLPGLFFALGAYVTWGLFPLYWKQLDHVPALEILAHRILWTLPFIALILFLNGSWQSVRAVLANWRQLALLSLTACLVATNWGVFIWAVMAGRILEVSLGYYITPLVAVFLGVVVLGERLRVGQWLAVALVSLGVLNLLWFEGVVPWAGLTVAFTFGFYGVLRKRAAIHSAPGLFIEALVLSPLALGWLIWLGVQGKGLFLEATIGNDLLLVGSGVLTAVPMLFYVAATRRVRFSTLGLLFYLNPTLHLLLGTLVYGEVLSWSQIMTFLVIWTALSLYLLEGHLHGRRRAVPLPV